MTTSARGSWANGLTDDVARRLAQLNPPRYLSFKTDQIERHRDVAASLPDRWDVVEIGSNRGRFCLGWAQRQPTHRVLALEWRDKWVRKVVATAQQAKLRNVHCLRADARIALPILLRPASIARLFLLYPDPWWKERHTRRRLLDRPFLELASELLEPGGLLLVKTDVRVVRERVLEASASVPALRLLEPHDWPDESDWPNSTRELRVMAAGIPTFRLYWVRTRALRPLPEDLDAGHQRTDVIDGRL